MEFHFIKGTAVYRLTGPVLAAGGLDCASRNIHVIHQEADVVHADELAAAPARRLLGLIVE